MGYFAPQRLAVYVEAVRANEGYEAARDLVADWLDCLHEMAEAGLDVSEIIHHVQAAADSLNIATRKR